MTGWLTPDYTPFVSVEVTEAGTFHDLVVDTGFNDYLYLPEDVIADRSPIELDEQQAEVRITPL
jgi:predicted aspartyl protease